MIDVDMKLSEGRCKIQLNAFFLHRARTNKWEKKNHAHVKRPTRLLNEYFGNKAFAAWYENL
mgnify:CR=1 FL=1